MLINKIPQNRRVKFKIGATEKEIDALPYFVWKNPNGDWSGVSNAYSMDKPKWFYGNLIEILDNGITEPIGVIELDGTYKGKKIIEIFVKDLKIARREYF